MMLEEHFGETAGSAAKFEDRLRPSEIGVADRLLSGSIFVESVAVLVSTSSIVGCSRFFVRERSTVSDHCHIVIAV